MGKTKLDRVAPQWRHPNAVDKKDGNCPHKRREDAAAPSNLKRKRPIPAILTDERECAFTSQMNPVGPRNPL